MIGTKVRYELWSDLIVRLSPKSDRVMIGPQLAALELWHEHLGHIYHGTIKHMVSASMVKGLNLAKEPTKEAISPTCVVGKYHRLPFRPITIHASHHLDQVHIDICGPMQTVSIGRRHYFLLIVDDTTRYTCRLFPSGK
jgi:hypothetical protein